MPKLTAYPNASRGTRRTLTIDTSRSPSISEISIRLIDNEIITKTMQDHNPLRDAINERNRERKERKKTPAVSKIGHTFGHTDATAV